MSAVSTRNRAEPIGDDNVLTTVRIPTAVKAGGTLLPAASYQLRLTGEHPAPGGEQREVQEWVEFISNGKVMARELAEILYDDDRPAVGASAQKARTGTRVEMLKDESSFASRSSATTSATSFTCRSAAVDLLCGSLKLRTSHQFVRIAAAAFRGSESIGRESPADRG